VTWRQEAVARPAAILPVLLGVMLTVGGFFSWGASSIASAETYEQAVEGTSGVVHFWPMGESSGSSFADVVGGDDAEASGGVTLGEPGGLVGDSSTSALFDGSSGAVGVARPDRKISLKKCALGHLRVIVADAQASVYEAPEPPGPSGGLGVWGCVYGHRPYFLGPLPYDSASGSGGLKDETLSGSDVAYEEYSSGSTESGTAEWRVIVRDLRNGHVLHREPTGIASPSNPKIIGAGFTRAIVVKSDGAVAWIVEYPVRQETAYEVHAVDGTGSRLLASGSNIGPTSLALAGSTLYWTQGGVPFSALLK
jgi:hypothetical protein